MITPFSNIKHQVSANEKPVLKKPIRISPDVMVVTIPEPIVRLLHLDDQRIWFEQILLASYKFLLLLPLEADEKLEVLKHYYGITYTTEFVVRE